MYQQKRTKKFNNSSEIYFKNNNRYNNYYNKFKPKGQYDKTRIFTINKYDLVVHKIVDLYTDEELALLKVHYDNDVKLSIKFHSKEEMLFWKRKLKRVIEKNAEKEVKEKTNDSRYQSTR